MERRRRSCDAAARDDRARRAATVGAAADGGGAAESLASAHGARERSLSAPGESQTDALAEPRALSGDGCAIDAAHSRGHRAFARLPEAGRWREAGHVHAIAGN